ncbi:CBS domain-containing protein [Mongoliitalea daihaiensis]|uniref:CBS domain-containing protein n=1 Tax=Mongoliitalea daihaiensis TaxID=2782006 RepID=UPI001F2909E1|nr:CBS domain-containing protein [Mongoliitalea daihaiensis]UJP63439.1 CBS domain-containing protein [Mongoliitalea daihaiensis]
MKTQVPIKNIMTTHVFSIQENGDLNEVINMFKKHKVRHVPVLRGMQLVGMISRTDINRLSFGALFENQSNADETVLEMLSIPEVMTSKLKVAHAEQSIQEVGQIFTTEKFHILPVVEDGNLVGIVSTTDIILYFLQNCHCE